MLITTSPSVNLDATSFHIFTEPLGLYLSQNICWIFCWACITHYVRGKSPNLWCLDYWNKHLHDKKSILDIFTHSSGKTFSKVLLITHQADENYSVPVFLPAEKEGGGGDYACLLYFDMYRGEWRVNYAFRQSLAVTDESWTYLLDI